jgi:hypothetical protein
MPTTNITKNTPTPTPVLKMPPITEQLESVNKKADMNAIRNLLVFIRFFEVENEIILTNVNYYKSLIFIRKFVTYFLKKLTYFTGFLKFYFIISTKALSISFILSSSPTFSKATVRFLNTLRIMSIF